MTSPNDWNTKIIEEFRATGGKPGGMWEGRPLLLLTTKGARSGKDHTTPVMYTTDGPRLVVIASKGGAPSHPAWYHNLVANPAVTVEVGTEKFQAKATVAQGAERDELYRRQAEQFPQFAEYQQKTSRSIPVVVLERIAS